MYNYGLIGGAMPRRRRSGMGGVYASAPAMSTDMMAQPQRPVLPPGDQMPDYNDATAARPVSGAGATGQAHAGLIGGAAPKKRRGPEAMMRVGAILKDVGNTFRGGNSDYVGQTNQYFADQKKQAEWETTVDQMGLDPEMAAYAKANRDAFMQAQMENATWQKRYDTQRGDQIEDRDWGANREDRVYGRNRRDELSDMGMQRGWQVEDREDNQRFQGSMAQARRAQRDAFRPATPQEIAAAGLPEGTSAQINLADDRIDVLFRPRQDAEFDPTTARQYVKKAESLDAFESALNDYIRILEENGGPQTLEAPWNVNQRRNIDAAHNQLTLVLKNAEQGGALDQGLIDITNKIISDPTGWSAFGMDTDAAQSALETVYNRIGVQRGQIPQQFVDRARPNAPAAAGADDIPVIASKEERDALPPGTRYMAPNGQIMVKR